MYPLFLLTMLTLLTLGLAQRFGQLRDTTLVIAASLVSGVVFLAAHPALGWLAEQPEEGSCGLEGEDDLAIRVERISVAAAQALLADETVTFVDARSSGDYTSAHIPGAVSLPASDAAGILEIQSVPILPDGQVVTYCDGGTCEQSEYLGVLLRDREVCKQVFVLEGGWAAWVDASAPTVSGEDQDGSISIGTASPSPSEPCEPSESPTEARG